MLDKLEKSPHQRCCLPVHPSFSKRPPLLPSLNYPINCQSGNKQKQGRGQQKRHQGVNAGSKIMEFESILRFQTFLKAITLVVSAIGLVVSCIQLRSRDQTWRISFECNYFSGRWIINQLLCQNAAQKYPVQG